MNDQKNRGAATNDLLPLPFLPPKSLRFSLSPTLLLPVPCLSTVL